MIRNNVNEKGNEMNNDFQKLVEHLMGKGFSKLEAKRLALRVSIARRVKRWSELTLKMKEVK